MKLTKYSLIMEQMDKEYNAILVTLMNHTLSERCGSLCHIELEIEYICFLILYNSLINIPNKSIINKYFNYLKGDGGCHGSQHLSSNNFYGGAQQRSDRNGSFFITS